MKKISIVLLLLVVIGSCSLVAVRIVRLTPDVKHVDVKLVEDAGKCKINYPDDPHPARGDLVHWALKGEGGMCAHKKIKVAHGSQDFRICKDLTPAPNPFVKCDEKEVDMGDLTNERHYYCRVDPFAKLGCYKYSFTGDVTLDPEIEVERPRLTFLERFLLRFLSLFS